MKFTFDKILDKNTNTVRRSNFILDGEPIRFSLIDDYTIKVVLPKPFAPFLNRMAMGILPKHILNDQDINKSSFNRAPIDQVYKFNSWQSAQFVQLDRYDQYHFGKPKTKHIIMKIIPDSNTALLSLEKGEIDESGIPPKDYDRYSNKDRFWIFTNTMIWFTPTWDLI